MRDLNYVVFDLETTGLDITEDEPIQLYFGAFGDKGFRGELFLHSYGLRRISSGAEAVHGISWEILHEIGEPAHQVVIEITSFLWKYQPLALVGWNALNFDFPMLQNWLSRHGIGRFRHVPCVKVIDTMHLFGAYFHERKWTQLQLAARRLGLVVPEKLHDARADGRLLWEIWKELRKRTEDTKL